MHVVIVGAIRGIGLALASQYCQRGDQVTALCRHSSETLSQLGCTVITGIDVTNDESIHGLAEKIPDTPVDILIHNSGILHSDSFPTLSIDEMHTHFNVNSLGPLRTVLALRSRLSAGSKIGIVSSRVGSINDNSSSNNYAYRVSKAAVNMIGKCLSIDLAPEGIAVALLHPGYVRTEMTARRGLIDTEESARGLIAQMDKLTLENTGCFVHTNGETLPW